MRNTYNHFHHLCCRCCLHIDHDHRHHRCCHHHQWWRWWWRSKKLNYITPSSLTSHFRPGGGPWTRGRGGKLQLKKCFEVHVPPMPFIAPHSQSRGATRARRSGAFRWRPTPGQAPGQWFARYGAMSLKAKMMVRGLLDQLAANLGA